MNSPSTGKRRAHRRTQTATATLSPPRNKVWTRFGPSYWTAGDYFIRQDQTGFRLGEYSGRTQHQIGTYPTLEQAQGAIQKENPTKTFGISEEYYDLALVLGLGAGAIYLVYKAASALGTALGKSIGSATPASGA